MSDLTFLGWLQRHHPGYVPCHAHKAEAQSLLDQCWEQGIDAVVIYVAVRHASTWPQWRNRVVALIRRAVEYGAPLEGT